MIRKLPAEAGSFFVIGRIYSRYIPRVLTDMPEQRSPGVYMILSGLAVIGRTHLSAIERGERRPTLETLYRISCALGVRMSEIVGVIEKRLKVP